MFKKSPSTKQFDMFNSPSSMMCDRESRYYDDPSSWHMKFYEEITSKIDETIFQPLFTEGNEGGKDGRPNASIRIIIAMCVIKEGYGYSDEALFEICRFHVLYRRALGLVGMDEQCPSLGAYYALRKRICEYEEEHEVNLLEECFKSITKNQIKTYQISGKSVRMDSKLISSNIAWYSRYELIHKTFLLATQDYNKYRISNQAIREMFLDFRQEDAAKTVYRTEPEPMNKRLLNLGLVIDYILKRSKEGEYPMLQRVFREQYEKAKDGTISVRDKRLISSKSLQNPHDPDAQYRNKGGNKVKGYNTNITETTDEKNKPSLITNIQVKGATAADNGYVEESIKQTEEVTENKVDVVYADGAYQSEGNRQLASDEENGFEFVANGIQGKQSRFEPNQIDEHTLEVTDKETSEVIIATPTRNKNQWKIKVKDRDGKLVWKYFGKEQIEKASTRQKIDFIPIEKRIKRNNVEATIFQYCYHTRNNKTRYRGLLKHKLQAFARGLWINMRRLFIFDQKMQLQMA